jgi:hypothetical protein
MTSPSCRPVPRRRSRAPMDVHAARRPEADQAWTWEAFNAHRVHGDSLVTTVKARHLLEGSSSTTCLPMPASRRPRVPARPPSTAPTNVPFYDLTLDGDDRHHYDEGGADHGRRRLVVPHLYSGSRRSGSMACSSPRATRPDSGSCAATTCTATRGASSAIPMTDASGPDARVAASVAGRERWQPAVIAAIVPLTPAVVSVRLRPQHTRPFLAGQHVDVRLTAEDGYRAQRSYSVASAPDEGDTINWSSNGWTTARSTYFHDSAAPRHRRDRGAACQLFRVSRSRRGVLLAAGGRGRAIPVDGATARPRRPDTDAAALLARTWATSSRATNSLHMNADGATACFCLTRDVTRRCRTLRGASTRL